MKLKDMNMFCVLRSIYCKLTFAISLMVSYLLIPKDIFYGRYFMLAAVFMIVFAITITCVVRNIKENILNMKRTGSSVISILSALLGVGALQACALSAPVCSAAGIGIISLFVPGFMVGLVSHHSVYIIIFSIIIQTGSLYHMGCFKQKHMSLK